MMTPTPTRDDLHELVDRLPESQWSAAQRALQYLHLVTTTPVDDEPWTDEDEAALQEAEEEIARGDIMSHEDARRLLLER